MYSLDLHKDTTGKLKKQAAVKAERKLSAYFCPKANKIFGDFKNEKSRINSILAMDNVSTKIVNEGLGGFTSTGDINKFYPIIMNMNRRIFPQLIANDIFGVQPIGPVGMAYALRYGYLGTDKHKIDKANLGRVLNVEVTTGNGAEQNKFYPGRYITQVKAVGGQNITLVSIIVAVLPSRDGNPLRRDILVEILSPIMRDEMYGVDTPMVEFANASACSLVDTDGATPVVVTGGLNLVRSRLPEAGFNLILKNYSGLSLVQGDDRNATALGVSEDGKYHAFSQDELTDAGGRLTGMKTRVGERLDVNRRKMGLYIEKAVVEAMTRWLEASYSVESAQDIKTMQNINVEDELMEILSYEIAIEINREMVDHCKAVAQQNSHTWDFADASLDPYVDLTDKFRLFYSKVQKVGKEIGKATMRGQANFAIVSPGVAVLLSSMQNYKLTNVDGNISQDKFGYSQVGVLNGELTIYEDIFANHEDLGVEDDYMIIGYSGTTDSDQGIIYCPYIPAEIIKTQGEDNLMTSLHYQTRYGILDNLYGASSYYRYLSVANMPWVQ